MEVGGDEVRSLITAPRLGRHVDGQSQPLGILQAAQEWTAEPDGVHGDGEHIVAMSALFAGDQLFSIGRFVPVSRWGVHLGDQFAVGIHTDIELIAVVVLAMFARASVRIMG